MRLISAKYDFFFAAGDASVLNPYLDGTLNICTATAELNKKVLSLICKCCDYFEVRKSSNNIRVQLEIIQYIFWIKIVSKDTPSFQRRDWLKSKRYNEFGIRCIRCSTSKAKYGKCE